MPIIQFNLMEGRTVEQKKRLAEKVADTVVEVLGVRRETVRILIHELGPYDFSVGGVTQAERVASSAAAKIPEGATS
jgi:4-oxalocrotonate tautomerase